MKYKNSGAAFPTPVMGDQRDCTIGGEIPDAHDCGMSLRDYFAAAALTGILATQYEDPPLADSDMAEWAYKVADAMLKERDNARTDTD